MSRLLTGCALLASAFWFTSIPSDAASAPISGLYGSGQTQENATIIASSVPLVRINETTGVGTFVCMMSQPGTEMVYDNLGQRAFQQQPDGAFSITQFDATTCANIGLGVADGHSFTGLEYVGSTLYGAGIDTGGGPSSLYTLNPTTGASALVGATGVNLPLAGLAYDQGSATMYGITGGPTAALYRLNLATGAATLVGLSGIQAGSLEFGLTGVLFAGGTGSNAGNLYSINRTTGVATLVGNTTLPTVTSLMLVIPSVPSMPAWSILALGVALSLLAFRTLRLKRA
jgi:hypothetical protein